MKEIKTIGVIGLGMVGSVVYKYFKDAGKEVYGYSNTSRDEEVKTLNCDLVFVCVPTPFLWKEGKVDLSIVESEVSKINDGAIVVIKSTVRIGTTERLQNLYPYLKFLFNPEFLSEATAYGDFVNPDRQFVGYTKESYNEAIQVLNLLPESAYALICPSKEAELLKFINNLHGVLEVLESNHYYEICKEEGLDYERVSKAMVASKWIGCPMGRHYRVIYHKGKRGVGGKCFPKDLSSWIEYCEDKGIDNELFMAAKAMNKRILKSQDLTEEQAEQISKEEDVEKVKKGKI